MLIAVPVLPRFYAAMQRIEDDRKIGRILLETGEVPADLSLRAGATAGGDRRRARGVPIVGRGIGGTAPGTDPLNELLRKENGRRR